MENLTNSENRKNKIFYITLFSLIALSVLVTFLKIVVYKNYQIVSETSCYPYMEKCFVRECDKVVDDTCIENSVTYYKIISKKAANIASCESSLFKKGCRGELSCIEGEKDCFYTFCDPMALADGEKCSE